MFVKELTNQSLATFQNVTMETKIIIQKLTKI